MNVFVTKYKVKKNRAITVVKNACHHISFSRLEFSIHTWVDQWINTYIQLVLFRYTGREMDIGMHR